MSDSKPAIVTVKHVKGMVVPDVSALDDTSKDWLYQGGLYRPPLPATTITFNPFSTVSWISPNYFLNPTSTTFTIGPGALPVPSTPTELPVEKRDMPVVGYRAWGFSSKYRIGLGRDVALKSTGVDYHWRKGENRATCLTGGAARHPAPQVACFCGHYVLANLDEVEKHQALGDGVVVGAVMGWGKVVQHGTEGWRAELAKIIALLDCKYSKGQLRNTQQAAAAYGVEVKTRDALEAMVSEFGDPFQ